MSDWNYALVTPARNEEAFITRTIEAVLAQTILPKKWIIVSDGSTDRTDELVAGFVRQHQFITLVRTDINKKRSFGSKANAFRLGGEFLCGVEFDYLGNLDADVSFGRDYFECVLQRFRVSPRLGLAGGIILELVDGRFVEQRTSLDSVAGAVQLFRRACYDAIGGYLPLRFGGVDSAAEIMARMHGWEVATIPDLRVFHHRRVSSGSGGLVRTKIRYGMAHYALGYHPLFQLVRCVYRVTERPYLASSVLLMAGYVWAWLTRMEKGVPSQVVSYLRSEQMSRLRGMCFGRRRAALL